ncbi:hypothetical protein EDC04DRAFT_2653506 [Pisolithus marmoratus]|nr:hypothetical protein EDC04DRAFT_2653506 [Pisolithus marmoratus]
MPPCRVQTVHKREEVRAFLSLHLLLPHVVADLCPYTMVEEHRNTLSFIGHRLRAVFCLIILGTPSRERLLQISYREKEWSEFKSRLTDRATSVSVVGGLGVAAAAAFMTTTSPTDFVKWNRPLPYFCVGMTLWSSMLAVVAGFNLQIFLSVVRPEFIETAQESVFKYYSLVVLPMMPLFFLYLAGLFSLNAWVGSVWDIGFWGPGWDSGQFQLMAPLVYFLIFFLTNICVIIAVLWSSVDCTPPIDRGTGSIPENHGIWPVSTLY